MADFSGTGANEQITPTNVSNTVAVLPEGSIPSGDDDIIDGGGGTDNIAGGGGADTISFSGYGSLADGNAGGDTVRFDVPLAGGDVFGTAYGDGGADNVSVPCQQRGFRHRVPRERGPARRRGRRHHRWLAWISSANDSKPSAGLDVSMYGDAGNDQINASTHLTGSSYMPEEGGNNSDRLYGGSGDDTYKVQERQDVVIEKPGQGYDTVVVNNSSTGSYTLSPNVEQVEVWDWYSHLPCDLTGNDRPNFIRGTAAKNTLKGLEAQTRLRVRRAATPSTATSATTRSTARTATTPFTAAAAWTIPPTGRTGSTATPATTRCGRAAATTSSTAAPATRSTSPARAATILYMAMPEPTISSAVPARTSFTAGGDDILRGGAGLDRLFGSDGGDTFDYDAVSDSRRARSHARRDRRLQRRRGIARTDVIDLSTIDANSGVGGNQAFTFRGTSAFSAPGQVRVQASGPRIL